MQLDGSVIANKLAAQIGQLHLALAAEQTKTEMLEAHVADLTAQLVVRDEASHT